MIALDDLRLLVRIADAGNLSAAARQLGWLPATASAALKRVESELGARLFERTTRSMRPTEAGLRYLGYARQALEALDEGAESLGQDRTELAGPIRIAATSDLGRNLLRPWLDTFCDEHPGVRVTLMLGDRLADLMREDLDFALRYGHLQDSALVRRPLASHPRVIVGAPSYFRRHGRPTHPDALRDHRCLILLRNGEPVTRWQLTHASGPVPVDVRGDFQCDDGAVVRDWAIAGRGLAFKAWLDVARDVYAGRLEVALPAWAHAPTPLQLVSLARRHRPVRLTACADFLAARFTQFSARYPFPPASAAAASSSATPAIAANT
ncbi:MULTISPECIES: LysR family transcriptional regulator [Ralstonia solanacearum species complex]|uniref:LysR family transcriptional regulator n=1 Tax=Ralstonia solanacearum species complex TaxID=3116862 RepID=UPI000E576D6E|nr:LysR family transcriptional regulator [Ralstonia solanacearum]BEU71699.1 LysR family transcriptional regulator [Ralstonia pseudosolanacearum]AXV76636.1 LysR family transcriptional regulator [Ralstonia solanacearum]AXV90645.1 LysR family transcriptional regulator [Ralstonia solanacearum]AXW18813.1 LysR family transcriptional regulator [Ralstonia solanacearum]AXW75561.1 LysR family transcriptional regulator [Ralstonia solanacearum]